MILRMPSPNALLFKRDSVHGTWAGTVSAEGDVMIVDGKRSRSQQSAIRPSCLTLIWASISRSSAPFLRRQGRRAEASRCGAKRVLISAPAKGADLTVVYGVNHDKLTAGSPDRVQRQLHDKLPGAGRQGA